MTAFVKRSRTSISRNWSEFGIEEAARGRRRIGGIFLNGIPPENEIKPLTNLFLQIHAHSHIAMNTKGTDMQNSVLRFIKFMKYTGKPEGLILIREP